LLFILLLILGGLSLVALIAGFVWQLTRGACGVRAAPKWEQSWGRRRRPDGVRSPQRCPSSLRLSPKELALRFRERPEPPSRLSRRRSGPAGGGRRSPGLLLAGGLSGLLLFGSLALVTTLENKLLGLAAVAIAVFITATEVRDYLRA